MSSTPYDDVFRTLLNDCSSLALPVINEAFHETYTGNEKIQFLQNEHYLNQQDGGEEKRVTDTCFVVQGDHKKRYHWECQSTKDNRILARIFEYDAQIAIDSGEIKGDVLEVEFPHSAVLSLRDTPSSSSQMSIRIITPEETVEYKIPVMKLCSYTLEEIFRKNLLFLLPFYIFNHEKKFKEYENNAEKLKKLQEEYSYLVSELENLVKKGKLGEYEKCTIIDMCKKVLENIASKYEKVRKGVRKVMGGQILEYEAKTILNKGMEKGMEKGKEESRKEDIALVAKLLNTGRLEELMKATENPAYWEQLCEELKIDFSK